MEDYVSNYVRAIDNPLPELKETFGAELEFLKKNIKNNFTVLDVGCGAGRPANVVSRFVQKLVGTDNDRKMLKLARERCKGIVNVKLLEDNALKMQFKDNSFDLIYATYNLIGSIKKEERQQLINEMTRVAKKGSKVINITWKDNKETTEFLKKYYPSIGIGITKADESKTITSKGTFARISKTEMEDYYKNSGLNNIKFFDIGPVWIAIMGEK